MAVGDGQKIVKVPRGKKKSEAPPLRSIDDVAARYHTAHDVVPPDEEDPAKRRLPTISAIELEDDAPERSSLDDLPGARQESELAPADTSDGQMRTLEDLMARFPFGDGQYFIHVTRLQPRMVARVAVGGVQRPIDQHLTLDGFIDIYGGGSYQLIVYGPPRRGGQVDTEGNVIPKALTKPIKFTIPWAGDYAIPPNQDSLPGAIDDEEEDPMIRYQNRSGDERPSFRHSLLGRRGIMTPAHADIHKNELAAEERREELAREEAKQERRERKLAEQSVVEAVKSSSETTVEILMKQMEKLEHELAQERAQNGKNNGVESVLSLASALQPKADPAEINRLRDSHKMEIDRIQEAHRQSLETLRTRHEDEIARLRAGEREELARLNRRLEEMERKSQAEIEAAQRTARVDVTSAQENARKDIERLERDHTRALESLSKDHQRQIDHMKMTHDQVLSSERSSFERERTMARELQATRVDSEKSVLQGQIDQLKLQLTTLQTENAALKSDLSKKGSLPQQLGEFRELATALGYDNSKGAGEEGEEREPTMKEMLLTGLGALASKLPSIIEAASTAVQSARTPQQQPAAPTVYRQMMPQSQAMPMQQPPQQIWQSEDSLEMAPLPTSMQQPISLVPTMPPPAPAQVMQQPPEPQAFHQSQYPVPEQQMRPVPPPLQAQLPAAAPAGPPPQQRRTRRVAASAPAAVPIAAPAAPVGEAFTPEQFAMVRPELEQALERGMTPRELAEDLKNRFGMAVLGPASQITPEAVLGVLQQIGEPNSPLGRREGQKFLRELRAEFLRILQSQGASA